MADIFVTINVRPHPTQNDLLDLTIEPDALDPNGDPSTVYLSTEDNDRIVWLLNTESVGGSGLVRLAEGNNPFDPTSSTGGVYNTVIGGSVNSGAVVVTPPSEESLFLEFKYSVVVDSTDHLRHGSIDPHIRIRGKSVYKPVA
ncbi:MAG: hypothetical protein ACKVX9_04815 [Blastocatellia bacterium]